MITYNKYVCQFVSDSSATMTTDVCHFLVGLPVFPFRKRTRDRQLCVFPFRYPKSYHTCYIIINYHIPPTEYLITYRVYHTVYIMNIKMYIFLLQL